MNPTPMLHSRTITSTIHDNVVQGSPSIERHGIAVVHFLAAVEPNWLASCPLVGVDELPRPREWVIPTSTPTTGSFLVLPFHFGISHRIECYYGPICMIFRSCAKSNTPTTSNPSASQMRSLTQFPRAKRLFVLGIA